MDPALLGASIAAVPALVALATVAGLARSRRKRRIREHLRKVDIPGSRKDLALILAMGGDPQKHRILVVSKPLKGLRLVDDDGKPVKFLTERQLRTPALQQRFRQALREVDLTVAAP